MSWYISSYLWCPHFTPITLNEWWITSLDSELVLPFLKFCQVTIQSILRKAAGCLAYASYFFGLPSPFPFFTRWIKNSIIYFLLLKWLTFQYNFLMSCIRSDMPVKLLRNLILLFHLMVYLRLLWRSRKNMSSI